MPNKILQGDSLKELRKLEENSIDCVVTSPPYWALRDYGIDGQLGLESNFQDYINRLCDIFDEIRRVLKKEGTCFVNLGDTYGGSGKGAGGYSNKSTLSGFTSQDTKGRKMAKESWNFKKAPSTENDIPKSLCQIPSRFAIEMTNRGWILRNEIIWHKPNQMPSSVTDRFSVDFEKMFFFTKNTKYYFEQQFDSAITKENRPHSVVRDRELGYDSKRKAMSKKLANGAVKRTGGAISGGTDNSTLGISAYEKRNKRAVWSINTKPYNEAHFATYPEELIETPIKAGCPVGGIVLDPFFGSGTTGVVAIKLGRKYLGIELNPAYIKIAQDRLDALGEPLF